MENENKTEMPTSETKSACLPSYKVLGDGMTTDEALKITNAITTLADLFGESPQEFATSLCIFHEHRLEPVNKAIRKNKEFIDSDIVKRGELLGITITKTDQGYESTIVLSES